MKYPVEMASGGMLYMGFMKYPVEMASRGMMYIPRFIQIGSGLRKLLEGLHIQAYIDRQTHTHSKESP
jgi:hypothetical protein